MSRRKRKKRQKRAKREANKQQPDRQLPPPPPPANPVAENQEQQPEAKTHPPTAPQQNNGERPSRTDWPVLWQVVFSGCLVVFAAAQTYTSYLNWDSTNDQYKAMLAQNETARGQLKLAEDGLALTKMDQRAWLFIEQPTIESFGVGVPFLCSTKVQNIGRSPATITKRRIESRIEPRGTPIEKLVAETDTKVFAPIALAGGTELIMPSDAWIGPPLTEKLVSGVKDGSLILTTFVRCEYLIAGEQNKLHVTEVLYQYFPKSGLMMIRDNYIRID